MAKKHDQTTKTSDQYKKNVFPSAAAPLPSSIAMQTGKRPFHVLIFLIENRILSRRSVPVFRYKIQSIPNQ